MNVPDTLDGWLAGGPWWFSPEEYQVVFGNRHRYKPHPFGLYLHEHTEDFLGHTHEVAHLIGAQDHHVLDPFWGYDEFPDPEHKLSVPCVQNEIKTLAIQHALVNHLRSGMLGSMFSEVLRSVFKYTEFPAAFVTPEDHYFWIRKEVAGHQYWQDINNVHNELRRKYALIREVHGRHQTEAQALGQP